MMKRFPEDYEIVLMGDKLFINHLICKKTVENCSCFLYPERHFHLAYLESQEGRLDKKADAGNP